jgi:ferredoxin
MMISRATDSLFNTQRGETMTLKIHVDMEKCQHYGQCVFDAPAVFRLNDDDKLEYQSTADDSERENIQLAIDICPMQAIRFVE